MRTGVRQERSEAPYGFTTEEQEAILKFKTRTNCLRQTSQSRAAGYEPRVCASSPCNAFRGLPTPQDELQALRVTFCW